MKNIRILLAIPAYRCETQIKRVLSGLHVLRNQIPGVESVIVFDNQSPDATLSHAKTQVAFDQSQDWIKVELNRENVGLGGTHKIAFDRAINLNFTHIIIFHGDDQGRVEEIPKIIDGLLSGYDAVLGSRFMSDSLLPGYSYKRIIGNRMLNLAYSCLSGLKVRDIGSGLNGFKISEFKPESYHRFSNEFTFNMSLLLYLIERKSRILFVPITWRETDQISNAKTFLVGWQSLKILLNWRFKPSRLRKVRNGD